MPDSTTDWTRFDFYASFVFALTILGKTRQPEFLDHDWYQALQTLRPSGVVTLKKLVWEYEDPRIDSYLPYFLSPHLTWVSFCREVSAITPELFRTLIPLLSGLRSFYLVPLNSADTRADIAEPISELICAMDDVH